MNEWTVSHADAIAGISDAKNSIAVNASETPITHQEERAVRLPGSGPIQPSRVATPMIPTVAYKFRPAAYATPAACASVCSPFTISPPSTERQNALLESIDEA
jgi:hypothetical protein